jgi:hypothetical protein
MSVWHLVTLAHELQALGVDLVVLDQAIDTTTPTGRLLLHILAAIAEFERGVDPRAAGGRPPPGSAARAPAGTPAAPPGGPRSGPGTSGRGAVAAGSGPSARHPRYDGATGARLALTYRPAASWAAGASRGMGRVNPTGTDRASSRRLHALVTPRTRPDLSRGRGTTLWKITRLWGELNPDGRHLCPHRFRELPLRRTDWFHDFKFFESWSTNVLAACDDSIAEGDATSSLLLFPHLEPGSIPRCYIDSVRIAFRRQKYIVFCALRQNL